MSINADSPVSKSDAEVAGRISLQAGATVPFLYFGAVAAGFFLYPGFSFVHQYASELGAQGAPHPLVFNIGLTLTGVAALASAFGYWHGLKRLGANPVLARLTACLMAMFGVAIVMAGVFPMPDWRHSGFGLSLPIFLCPALVARALRQRNDTVLLRKYLIASSVLAVAFSASMFCATRSPIAGLLQLLYSFAAVPWMGVAACALLRLTNSNGLTA